MHLTIHQIETLAARVRGNKRNALRRIFFSGGVQRREPFQRGFTLVELIMMMVIMGILAAVVAPRFFDTNVFQSRGFADQVQATLRYAQKTAIAQRRFVCAAFTSNSITLTINAVASCPGGDLASPSGDATYSITAPLNVTFSTIPTDFRFDALGRPSVGTSGIIGTTTITVEAETGYVHSP